MQTNKKQSTGYIQPQALKELWFHTGTICNLHCPFCLEGSNPGDNRLGQITLEDVKPFIDEALGLGVEQFSFTGGEPFVIKDMISILDYALDFRPCLVLTNATKPLKQRFKDIQSLSDKKNALRFRVSLDYPNPDKHDAGRGKGNFHLALEMLGRLYANGFSVSMARQMDKDEKSEEVDAQYYPFFKSVGLPKDIKIVRFPDFLTPGSVADIPQITEDCMTRYHTEESRQKFMCCTMKMVLKKNGSMRVYPCTLVDDDEAYDLGNNLTESMSARILLKHHRCYSCFAYGASCSES